MKSILSLLLLGLIVACGNDENATPFIGKQRINFAPDSIFAKAELWSQEGKSLISTPSSRFIREETIGVNIDTVPRAQNKIDVKISVSYSGSVDINQCSLAEYHIKDVSKKVFNSKVTVEGFGKVKCLQQEKNGTRCQYLYVQITQTPSSVFSEQTQQMVPASVFLIMENISTDPNKDSFIPTIVNRDGFLDFPKNENNYCRKPQQILREASEIIYPIDPTSDLADEPPSNYYDFSNSFF
jgi:hypothetical protein